MDVLDKAAAELDSALDGVDSALKPFLDAPLSRIASRLQPVETARLHSTLATSVLALASAYLRIGGIDVTDHEIKAEFGTLKRLNDRIQETEKSSTSSSSSSSSRLITKQTDRLTSGTSGHRQQIDKDSSSDSDNISSSNKGKTQTDTSRKRGRQQGEEEETVKGGGGGGGGGGGTRPKTTSNSSNNTSNSSKKPRPKAVSATPQPELAHTSWRKDMEKKFGK